MVPGMHHCSRGAGPHNFDPLTPLIGWVDAGIAPDRIIGEGGSSGGAHFPSLSVPQSVRLPGGRVEDAGNRRCKPGLIASAPTSIPLSVAGSGKRLRDVIFAEPCQDSITST